VSTRELKSGRVEPGPRRAVALLALAALLTCGANLLAQGTPRMKKLTVAGQSFAIDYPERDWSLVQGGNVALVTIVQRRFEAALIVERTPLQVELGEDDIGEVFLSVEADHIRETTPSATDMKADLQELGDRRVAAFVYRRNGVSGPERVLQYSMPAGKVLYRVVAVARPDVFDRHLPVLQAMAASLAPM
jgi:hypothetical protein